MATKKRKIAPTAIATVCPNAPKPKTDLDSFGQAVELTVGPTAEVFVFHKDHLCGIAPYFKAAFSGGFKEATEHRMVLLEESPRIVRRFQLWTYTGSIVGHTETGQLLDWSELLQLYIFAECRGIALLQDHVIDTLAADCHYSITLISAYTEYVYRNTENDSLLRKFFVYLAATSLVNGDIDNKDAFDEDCPKDFFMDLAFALIKTGHSQPGKRNPIENVCAFHIHPSGV